VLIQFAFALHRQTKRRPRQEGEGDRPLLGHPGDQPAYIITSNCRRTILYSARKTLGGAAPIGFLLPLVVRIVVALLSLLSLSSWTGCHSCYVDAMRLVVQRVKSASVTVEGSRVSSIGPGLVALVGLHEHDCDNDMTYCCRKLLAAKLWANDNGGQWRHGVKQKNLDLLCVSQFTLYGKLSKKNQPDYKMAMKAEPAETMYAAFLKMLKDNYDEEKIHDGVFGAMMDVELVNDGPVTIIIESAPSPPEQDQTPEIDDE